MTAPRAIAMETLALDVAIGGSELGRCVPAQAFAGNGHLVAALCHPGDNWTDCSLIVKGPEC